MKAIFAIVLAAALFLVGTPASAETGQEALNADAMPSTFVAPRGERITGAAATIHNLDESRPEVRD